MAQMKTYMVEITREIAHSGCVGKIYGYVPVEAKDHKEAIEHMRNILFDTQTRRNFLADPDNGVVWTEEPAEGGKETGWANVTGNIHSSTPVIIGLPAEHRI